MQPNEIATQTEESDESYEINNNEEIELPEELLDVQEERVNTAILMSIDERIDYVPPCYSGGDLHSGFEENVSESISSCNENDAEWCFGLKKELNLHKAMKEYGRQSSMKSMGQELLGIVKRKVWRPILKKSLTKTQRRKVLPCQGLQKLKMKQGEEIIKSRLVGGGHRQEYEDFDYYEDITAPTGSLSSLYALIVNSAAKGWKNLTTADRQSGS